MADSSEALLRLHRSVFARAALLTYPPSAIRYPLLSYLTNSANCRVSSLVIS
jgi:hypothetical protein